MLQYNTNIPKSHWLHSVTCLTHSDCMNMAAMLALWIAVLATVPTVSFSQYVMVQSSYIYDFHSCLLHYKPSPVPVSVFSNLQAPNLLSCSVNATLVVDMVPLYKIQNAIMQVVENETLVCSPVNPVVMEWNYELFENWFDYPNKAMCTMLKDNTLTIDEADLANYRP